MIKTDITGTISLKPFGTDFVEDIAAASAAKIANEFASYIRQHRFDEYYKNQTGETKNSIGVFRMKSKVPAFTVRAGLGIRGNLNYLAGLYKGKSVSRSGKTFSYARPRDLMKSGWREFGGEGKLQHIYEQTLAKKIKESEAKLEG